MNTPASRGEITANGANWQALEAEGEYKFRHRVGLMAWLGKDKRVQQTARDWHRAVLAKAREPGPYAQGLVADTLEGRFQMVALVATLVLRRMRTEEQGQKLADALYREVFSGFDHALREEGVGDSSIARRMRKLGEEFFGLARAVDAAFKAQAASGELASVLQRNGVTDAAGSAALSAWVSALAAALEQGDAAAILAAQPGWSDVQVQG